MDLAVNKVPDTTKWKNMAEKKGAIFGRKTRVFLVHEVEVWTQSPDTRRINKDIQNCKSSKTNFWTNFLSFKKKILLKRHKLKKNKQIFQKKTNCNKNK